MVCITVNIPKKIAVITIKFEQDGSRWLYHRGVHPKDADGMANSVDPDQTAPEQSDPGLHCLPGLSIQELRIIRYIWSLENKECYLSGH